MHQRLSVWMFVFAFAALGLVRAQSPAAPASAASAQTMKPGKIVVAKVVGSVSMLLNGATTVLKNGDTVSESATVITANDSSVILIFSNGATTQLGSDTRLVIEQFLQDPFGAEVKVAELQEEPTTSQTRLNLTKGELIGKVVHLNHEKGSTFTVQTPVGAAGIRGTTFRIVFRPSGTGQAFAVFSLSTVEGNVNFQQCAQGGPSGPGATQGAGQGQGTPGQTPGDGGQGQGGEPSTPGTSPSGPSGGVPVVTGQEVVVTVSVNVNPQTGQVTVTAPPTVTSTVTISAQTQAAITQQAQTMAVAAATTTFTPTTPSTPSTPPANTPGDQGQQPSTDTGGSTTPPTTGGNDSGGGNTPPNTGTTGTTGNTGTNTPTPKPYVPPAPPPTTPLPHTTPAAGQPG